MESGASFFYCFVKYFALYAELDHGEWLAWRGKNLT